MHAKLDIKGAVIMLSDNALGKSGSGNVQVLITVDSKEEIEKIESRRHISYVWIARDNRVMIDDAIVDVKNVSKIMYKKRINDPQIIVSLKIDLNTEMERVIEVQEELRLADATRINYATDFKAT